MSETISRIILNVGGVKYETRRETLLSLPESFLGTMFKDENLQMLKLENGNELFLDRNGRAFHYILEFYRTKKFLWRGHEHYIQTPEDIARGCCANMITQEEIESEIDFFQMPIVIGKPNPYTQMLNKFINMLENFISTSKGIYVNKLNITFPCYDKDGFFLEPRIKILNEILQPFSDCGFRILHKYGAMIGGYLKENHELKWECNVSDVGWHNAKCIVIIEIADIFDEDSIVTNSIIGSSKFMQLSQ